MLARAPRPEAVPFVSVIIPCLDEARFITGVLADLLGGTWPASRMEVLVVDGGSTDGTRELVAAAASRDARVRLVPNPRRTIPAALNLGLAAARGDIIVRADAHSRYPAEYLDVLAFTLDETGADMVGVREEADAADDTVMSRAIALLLRTPFATGSPYRFRRTSGPVDAVSFGCWRRELFDRVGHFDERLLRNQDNELSARIRRHGGRVHMTAALTLRYFARATLSALCRQAAETGTWNAFTQRLHPYTFRLRHFLPVLLFLGALAAAIAVIAGAFASVAGINGRALQLAGLAVVAPYVVANAVASIATGLASRRARLIPLFSLILYAFHLAYGFGIARGFALVVTGRWRRRLGATG